MADAPADMPERWKAAEKKLRTAFGKRVKKLREEQGITVEQAAEVAEYGPRHWQRIEAGSRGASFETVVRVAAALGVKPSNLFRS